MLWKRRAKEDDFARKPVGSLPFSSPPKCGLYKTSLTGSPPQRTSEAIRRLHKTVLMGMTESLATKELERNPYELLSVSSSCEPVAITADNSVNLVSTSRSISTTVRFTYRLDNNFIISSSQPNRDKKKTVAFFFPFSECGPHIESFSAKMNDVPLLGEVVRARRSDGRLIPSHEKYSKAFLGEHSESSDGGSEDVDRESDARRSSRTAGDGDDKQSKSSTATHGTEKLLYYFVVPDIQLTMYLPLRPDNAGVGAADSNSPAAARRTTGDTRVNPSNTTPFHVVVSWRCKAVAGDVADATGRNIAVAYSLYCMPRYPEHVSLLVKLEPTQKIRVIRCPNCRGGVILRARINGAAARAHVETVLGDPLRQYRLEGDYLFVFQIFLGEMPEFAERINKGGVAALLIVIAYFLWLFLTKDLIL